ncbi:MAG: tryptophan 7-halogenase [Bacteroidales bacterium]|nr:tryptophan 7-halogenase [Bacteroidales bacterium]
MTTAYPSETDVIVIGGGPGGTTTAAMLAQQGIRVHLFEREKFPRFHIGESMIPQSYWLFEKLGMLPKMVNSHFVKKYSVQFINPQGKLSEPFYFIDHKPHASSQTWQVRRSELDQMLLDNAREKGANIHEQTRVLEVIFEGKRAVGVRIQGPDGKQQEVRAKVVVDASGQSAVLQDRLNLREWDPELKKAALWTYWKGAQRDTGRDEGTTLVIQTEGKRAWFWYIPLHDDIVSIGVVGGFDYLFQNRASKDLETIYFEEVAKSPGLQPRIANATRCDIFRAQKEYSYKARQVAGEGWVLVGDAFGFLDPLYSSGVLLALKSGILASESIAEALAANDPSEARLRSWEPMFLKGMERIRRLVMEFYHGFSFGRFVRRHPDMKGLVTDVLIGDVFKDEVDVLWPLMDAMRAEMQANTAGATAQ